MGTMAVMFNGDADSEWIVVNQAVVRATKRGQLVAEVELYADRAVVTIPAAENLAEPKHWRDFNPRDFGFGPQALNWRLEPEPYVFQMPIPEDIPGLYARHRPPLREHQRQQVTVRRGIRV